MRHFGTVRAVLCGLLAAGGCAAALAGEPLEPPVGYIGIEQKFPTLSDEDAARGFFAIDYGLTLETPAKRLGGTFWSNTFEMLESEGGLPANHAGGLQGGYLGVQVLSDGTHQAIFSLWWASEAEAGPGAHCISDIEAWYDDDRPFEPEIDAMDKSDPSRRVLGGPFRSCRLPVTLKPGTHYALLLRAREDGSPEAGRWWEAWLADDASGKSVLIGALKAPAGWGLVDPDTGGFVEQMGPMPKGCDLLPAFSAVFGAAVANDAAVEAEVSARLYGVCEGPLKKRFKATPDNVGGVRVVVK